MRIFVESLDTFVQSNFLPVTLQTTCPTYWIMRSLHQAVWLSYVVFKQTKSTRSQFHSKLLTKPLAKYIEKNTTTLWDESFLNDKVDSGDDSSAKQSFPSPNFRVPIPRLRPKEYNFRDRVRDRDYFRSLVRFRVRDWDESWVERLGISIPSPPFYHIKRHKFRG